MKTLIALSLCVMAILGGGIATGGELPDAVQYLNDYVPVGIGPCTNVVTRVRHVCEFLWNPVDDSKHLAVYMEDGAFYEHYEMVRGEWILMYPVKSES